MGFVAEDDVVEVSEPLLHGHREFEPHPVVPRLQALGHLEIVGMKHQIQLQDLLDRRLARSDSCCKAPLTDARILLNYSSYFINPAQRPCWVWGRSPWLSCHYSGSVVLLDPNQE